MAPHLWSLLGFLVLVSAVAAGVPAEQSLDVAGALQRATSRAAAGTAEEFLNSDADGDAEDGLTLTLLHRDAFGNASVADTLRARLVRDAARVEALTRRAQAASTNASDGAGYAEWKQQRRGRPPAGRDFSSSIVSGLSDGSGEYFTRIGVGVPPRYNFMVLDTGSDLVWIQCKPCRRCYRQKDPVFDPAASSSFRHVPCTAPLCNKLDVSGCRNNRYCVYQVSYGDGSFTVGDFSTETLTFRGRVIKQVALGCGHDNEGLFVGAAGLLGLGRGSLSLPSQTGSQFRKTFSYCLVDRDSPAGASSALIFGPSAAPRAAVYTPLVNNPRMDTFYYVGVEGLSVSGRRLAAAPANLFRMDAATGNGGVILDCGTSVTRLVVPAYEALRDAFVAGTRHLRRAAAFSLFDTCYDLSGLTYVKVPTVVMHFAGGADVSLPANNYLIPVDTSGTFCLAFAGTTGGLNIIGNIQQQGFRVVFDGYANRLGFAAGSCSSS